MDPVVTPAEMAAIDADAAAGGLPVEELIERAGWATARAAVNLLGGRVSGRRIAVLAGKGNNGADGRRAARFLDRRGARCTVLDVPFGESAPNVGYDLIIDACFGTGLTRPFDARTVPIEPGDTPVLAVDIPSGVDGLTGAVGESHPLCAAATVTFGALKPGLLLEPGRRYAGVVTVAGIGIDCSRATIGHATMADVAARWPRRRPTGHKWDQAVYVVGGSPGMTGAPALAATAAFRAGAGMVSVAVPGSASGHVEPVEAVGHPAPVDWATTVLERISRFGAAVVGPGLDGEAAAEVSRYLRATETPTVFDASSLPVVSAARAALDAQPSARPGPRHVLTPHDGEFAALTGARPGTDRIEAVRRAADRFGMVVLLKGSTTVVAHPEGRVALVTAGDQRLSTAGSGDVLSGVIAAGIAGGLDPFDAATLGAVLHGRAASRGYRRGLVAGDLPSLVAAELSELVGG